MFRTRYNLKEFQTTFKIQPFYQPYQSNFFHTLIQFKIHFLDKIWYVMLYKRKFKRSIVRGATLATTVPTFTNIGCREEKATKNGKIIDFCG